jgi:regulator of extracellular matrix RemA (YlzA/DUF370 family)
MGTKLIHIGFGSYLSSDRVVSISQAKSAPIKRLIQNADDKGLLIDLTNGHKTKSVIFTDSQYIVLAALEPVTVNTRLEAGQ